MSARRGMNHFGHHARFYLAAAGGALVFVGAMALDGPTRALLAGDAFFLVYLALMLRLAFRLTPATLRARAATEDEGLPIILGLTAFAVVFVLAAVFLVTNDPSHPRVIPTLAVLSVPLCWTVVHMLATFHYADLYYSPAARAREGGERDDGPGDAGGLDFPATPEPDIGDFAYYSFVIGMTAQVSDVAVSSRGLRRATLVHGIVSFFFNTVLIALAVNIAVNLAG